MSEAQSLLSDIYLLRSSPLYEPAKGVSWLKAAVSNGSPAGMVRLAGMYSRGELVRKDTAEAERLLSKAAGSGDASAVLSLGKLAMESDPPDFARAVRCFSEAADGGSADAMVELAMMHLDGNGVQKDEARARELFEKAARSGSVSAMLITAKMYETRKMMSGSPLSDAFSWYMKAANLGSAEAEYNVARFIEERLVDIDRLLGRTSMRNISWTRSRPSSGNATHYPEAFRWYSLSAEQGYPPAEFAMYRFCSLGLGTQKSKKDADEWLMKAADHGSLRQR